MRKYITIVMLLIYSISYAAVDDNDVYWVNPKTQKYEPMNVKGFSKCMFERDDSRLCLPASKLKNCPLESWKKLHDMQVPRCNKMVNLPLNPDVVTYVDNISQA